MIFLEIFCTSMIAGDIFGDGDVDGDGDGDSSSPKMSREDSSHCDIFGDGDSSGLHQCMLFGAQLSVHGLM